MAKQYYRQQVAQALESSLVGHLGFGKKQFHREDRVRHWILVDDVALPPVRRSLVYSWAAVRHRRQHGGQFQNLVLCRSLMSVS